MPPQPPAIGTTVTLAVETPVGPIGVVGVLVEIGDETWSVRRRDGSVSVVNAAAITAHRVVPPSRAARASIADVEHTAALGWRALEAEPLGDWLLRASGGFTGRANSALAIGDPGRPTAAAVDALIDWYAGRGLPPRIQCVASDAPAGLLDELDARDWSRSPTVHVMTAEIGHVLRATAAAESAKGTSPADLEIRLDDAPDREWLACYRQDGGALPTVARDVLTHHPTVVFASIRDGKRAVAIARAAVDDRWAGLFAVEVAPDARRRGLGRVVSGAALRWAGRAGARRTYLQASSDNAAAISLYERLGYVVHHEYLYREQPSGQRVSG